MSNRLEELYEKMVDEAPFIFPTSNREYVFELAKIYATECVKASLDKAMVQVAWNFNDSDECKKAITNPENITLL